MRTHLLRACMLGTLLACLPMGTVLARQGVEYGPVPAGIAGVVASERDQTLAASGIATIEQGAADRDVAASLLILLEDVGLKAVAVHLAGGKASTRAMPYLLEVLASSEHPEADLLLQRAAEERRPVLRMLAAEGLGRGRSPRAVPILARLSSDPVPGVRIAALRSLFAIESPQATAARLAAPADSEPGLMAKRLAWHRRVGDSSPELRKLAEDAYFRGSRIPLRMAAAGYLAMPAAKASERVLRTLLLELGSGPVSALWLRRATGLPEVGYDPAAERSIAIEATFTLLARPDLPAEVRARVLHRAVGWIADPVDLDPYNRDPQPEQRLSRRLPDLGPEIMTPVLAHLRRGAFEDPRQGVILIRELGAEVAQPALRALLAPRTERPPFESRAESQRRRYLRNAAAGALQELGQIGEESLARALLLGNESETLKIDVIFALEHEPGSWAVPLLGEVVRSGDSDLRTFALDVLERRQEDEARTILIEDLFTRMDRPHDRLRPLVRAGDAQALEVIDRALRDKRSYMRKAGLSQFLRRTNPQLCGPDGRAVLIEHEPPMKSAQEIQGFVYALLNTDPERAVRYVATNWEAFPRDGVRMTCLRVLGEAYGKAARTAAVDLALSKATPGAPMQMLMSVAAVLSGPAGSDGSGGYGWALRPKKVAAFWMRLLDSEDVRLQREAVAAYTNEKAPDVADRLLYLLSRALSGEALDPDATTAEGEQTFARLVIGALRHQSWPRVESALIGITTDPLQEMNTRVVTAQTMIGRLSDAGRARLLTWLDYTQPEDAPASAPDKRKVPKPGAATNDVLQLFLAAAIGEKADATVAALLYATLKKEIFTFYNAERLSRLVSEGPAALEESRLDARVSALARGIGHTGHVPSVEALLEVVFDLRFALYARTCVREQASTMREASATAAALTPSDISLLTHNTRDSWYGMPGSVSKLVHETKRLPDHTLAAAMERVLQAAREDGRLAHFPALYLYRIVVNLLEPHAGRKPKTAAIVLQYARRTGRLDAPQHYALAVQAVQLHATAGRYAHAAVEQAHVVRVLARGNHDDAKPGLWRDNRAIQDALEGAAAETRGDKEGAAGLFMRATLRAPSIPDVLNTVAWYRACVDSGLDQAEVAALRATRLEARVENRPTANAADTLAYILLKRGRPLEGLRVLAPRMNDKQARENGLLYVHMAQLHTGLKRYRSARDALVEALTWDRALEASLRSDPYLAALRAKVGIDEISARAATRRLEQQLP